MERLTELKTAELQSINDNLTRAVCKLKTENAKLCELLECINEDMNDLQLCRTCKKYGTCYHANGRSCVNDKYEYAFADEVAEVLKDD